MNISEQSMIHQVHGKRSSNTRGIFAQHTSCDSHLRNFKWAYISSIFLPLAVDGPILNWYAIFSMSRSLSRILLNGEPCMYRCE